MFFVFLVCKQTTTEGSSSKANTGTDLLIVSTIGKKEISKSDVKTHFQLLLCIFVLVPVFFLTIVILLLIYDVLKVVIFELHRNAIQSLERRTVRLLIVLTLLLLMLRLLLLVVGLLLLITVVTTVTVILIA